MRIATFVLSTCLASTLTISCSKEKAQAKDPNPPASVEQAATAQITASGEQLLAINVNENGFAPNSVQLKRGVKATLRFTRTSDQTCATEVAVPDLGIQKPLPLNQAVDIVIPVDQARTLTFQCGMGMYKSKIVVL